MVGQHFNSPAPGWIQGYFMSFYFRTQDEGAIGSWSMFFSGQRGGTENPEHNSIPLFRCGIFISGHISLAIQVIWLSPSVAWGLLLFSWEMEEKREYLLNNNIRWEIIFHFSVWIISHVSPVFKEKWPTDIIWAEVCYCATHLKHNIKKKKILPWLHGQDGVVFGTKRERAQRLKSGDLCPVSVLLLANHMTFGKSLDNFGLQIFLKIN